MHEENFPTQSFVRNLTTSRANSFRKNNCRKKISNNT